MAIISEGKRYGWVYLFPRDLDRLEEVKEKIPNDWTRDGREGVSVSFEAVMKISSKRKDSIYNFFNNLMRP